MTHGSKILPEGEFKKKKNKPKTQHLTKTSKVVWGGKREKNPLNFIDLIKSRVYIPMNPRRLAPEFIIIHHKPDWLVGQPGQGQI